MIEKSLRVNLQHVHSFKQKAKCLIPISEMLLKTGLFREYHTYVKRRIELRLYIRRIVYNKVVQTVSTKENIATGPLYKQKTIVFVCARARSMTDVIDDVGIESKGIIRAV